MTDKENNLRDEFERYTDSYREELAEYGEIDVLDVEQFSNDRGQARTDIVLTLGGPTVYVVVSDYDRVVFHHSWCEEKSSEFSGSNAEFWRERANHFRRLNEV